MIQNNSPSETEMLEALKRSGYLFESEICEYLSKKGFFIESNQVIIDKITNKSREIDVTAEYFNFNQERAIYGVASKIRFIFEIKNNLYPIVLLTDWKSSPNIEDWMGLKEAMNIPKKIESLKYNWWESFYENLILDKNIYSQYCSFLQKKANDDLMALHPDNIYEGLNKITQYAEEMTKDLDTDLIYENEDIKSDVFRHFLHMPILLVKDNLYELHGEKLEKVDSSILVFNYHFNDVQKMAFVFVLTKNGFPNFIDRMIHLQDEVQQKMIKAIKGNA